MFSLLSKLSVLPKNVAIEPREIFMSLPQKDKRYEYPRDVQSEVWKKWFDIRNNKNCIIKMNTGSGKTVVGLMILQSCLNEKIGPAVYVVPDKYLVSQVCEEANKLGIKAVTNKDDYSYTEGKAILVTNIYSLVNGRSVFGMKSTNNYPISSILMDDVHACLDIIVSQFSIKIPFKHKLYEEIVNLFSSKWKQYNVNSYIDIIENHDPTKSAIIPFWMWQEEQDEIYKLLSKYNNQDEGNQCIYYNLPLLADSLATCDCFITSSCIEVIPEGIPISKIKNFITAQRRIFMSATLSDDSVFVSAIGLQENDVRSIISPDYANDIGDRLILFPRHLNCKITNDDIKNKVLEIAEKYNVIVIVPSFERAKFWDPQEKYTITKESIQKTVSSLKKQHLGCFVLVNRYDGIDLPDDACRLLVIDGLPPLRNEKDKYIQSIDSTSVILRREQIQRIEQGMGRGVRSNSDSCCVVLMGDDLADVLLRNQGVSFFSNATREQYNLSKELWDLLKQEKPTPNIDEIFELAEYSLKREVEWIQKSKENLSTVLYAAEPQFDKNALALRKVYNFSISQQWQKAIEVIDEAINNERQNSTKGYLLQIKAKLTNFIDKSKAQQILLSGKSLNTSILAPIRGIRYDKIVSNMSQAKAVCEYISNNQISQNDYVIHTNSITSRLVFSPEADEFESSFQKVGQLIGFVSTRPEKETNGRGPDNLWETDNKIYYIIECKSGAVSDTISKDYCNQLGGAMSWFNSEYKHESSPIPVMVHKSIIIDSQATAVQNMKVVTQEKLEQLKKSVNDFAIAASQNENWMDEGKIDRLLSQYQLRGSDISQYYMTQCRS